MTDVRVLDGGLQAWRRAGLPLVGTLPDPVSLARLAPAQLFQESRLDANLLVLLPAASTLRDALPEAVTVNAVADEAIRRALREREQTGKPFNALVILTGGPAHNADVERWLTAFGVPVLIYDGSAADYATYLNVQQGMWNSRRHGPRRPSCRG